VKCSKHRTDGKPCGKRAIAGTVSCEDHAGIPAAEHKAKGAVVLELRSWGLDDEELVDSTTVMLRLLAQSKRRVDKYGRLLGEAYGAAERLRAMGEPADLADDELPAHQDNPTDRERAFLDLQKVFIEGGVAALVGVKWGAAGKDGHLYQAEEAIRGLVRLESEERDRAFRFAKECRAANLDERLVRLAEGQQELVADYVNGVLAALGHDVQDPIVLRVLSEQLPALGASA
jgi:hypothetical protein